MNMLIINEQIETINKSQMTRQQLEHMVRLQAHGQSELESTGAERVQAKY